MNRRGHALALVMAVVAAMTIGGGIVTSQLSSRTHARRADDVRLQALWLARSALDAGITTGRRVDSSQGPASLHVERRGGVVVVQVDLAGASATIVSAPYSERFTAAPF